MAKPEASSTKERNIILRRRKRKLGEVVPSESPLERSKILGAEVSHWLSWAGDYFLWEM